MISGHEPRAEHDAPADLARLQAEFTALTHIPPNPFHPLVWVAGSPKLGQGVYIGAFSVLNAKGVNVEIGDGCDIASFVAINAADSHRRCLGLDEAIDRRDIVLEDHVFVGSHAVIKGGAHIGHHSVVGAGSVVGPGVIPPYSLVVGNPAVVKPGYYRDEVLAVRARDDARG
jgi:acetyltransferase-like isoleucine patch superfamily enzyme